MTGGTRRLAGALVAGGVLLSLSLAGCSASSDDSKSSSYTAGTADRAPAAANDKPQEAGAGGAADSAKGGTAPVVDPAQVPDNSQRSIIYTGDISVRVSNVDQAAQRLAGIATGVAGYVSADQRSINADASSAAVTLRVPADKFESTIDQITKLGKELNRQINSQDVTAQVVDLDSRMKTQQASVDRVRALLAQAQTIAEITSVEGELTRREADLESLKAQLAALSDKAALSTITVNLLGPEAAVVATHKQHTGFVGGLVSGWHAFTASIRVLLTVLGALLPFAIVVGVPALVIRALLRRRRRARAVAVAAPAETPAPPVAS